MNLLRFFVKSTKLKKTKKTHTHKNEKQTKIIAVNIDHSIDHDKIQK